MVLYGMSVIAGGLAHCDPSWSRPRLFNREFSRIYVPVSGRARFAVDERWTDLLPGRVYFIPGQPSNRQLCERSFSVHWMHVTPQSLPMAQAIARIATISSWPESRWRWWRPVYHRISEHCAGGGTALAASVHAFALAVTAAALAESGPADEARFQERARLEPALVLLERTLPRTMPIPALAHAAGLSVAQFRRRFHAAYGAAPRAFITRRRLEAAARELAVTSAPIAAIAAACGFEDPFHFSRAFRRLHRQSPSAFRSARQRPP